MTNFEIAMLLVLIAYGVIFGIICAGLFTRTRRNDSGIKATNRILDCHNMRIDGINSRIDHIVQVIGDYMDETHEPSEEKDRCVGVGKWIRFNYDWLNGETGWYGCSICHNRAPKNRYGIDYFSPYCPSCGTKMRSEVKK